MKVTKKDILVYSSLLIIGGISIYFASKKIIALNKEEQKIKDVLYE